MSFYLRGVKSKREFWAALRAMDGAAFDMESVGDTVIGLGLGDDSIGAYAAGESSIIEMLDHFEYIQGVRIAHSAQADLRALGAVEVEAFYPLFDTIIAAHIVGEYDFLNLAYLSRTIFDESIMGYDELLAKYKAKDLSGVPETAVADYNLRQIRATYKLYRYFNQMISNDTRLKRIFTLEMSILPILCRMEENGIMVDKNRLRMLEKRYRAEADALQDSVTALSHGHIKNVNSPKQVQEYLFGKGPGQLGLRPTVLTKGTKKPSSTERAVRKIMRREGASVNWLRILLRTRQIRKNIGTYCVGIAEGLDEEWRSHSHLSQITTDTGRLASKDPNHQNIPKRRAEGLDVRRCFIAPEGTVLMACDMDQIELRILAEEAQEERMIAAFRSGRDIHSETAMEMFHGDLSKRYAAKILNYTIVYLAGAEQIGDQMGESKEMAEMKQRQYFRVYPRLKQWMKEWDVICRELGYTETWLGRRRDVSIFYNDPRKGYPGGGSHKSAEWITEGTRKSVSTRIQGTAAEVVKLNMLKVDDEMRRLGLKSRLLMAIHDELLVEVPFEEVECMKDVLKRNMTTKYKGMDLPCTVKYGPNWADVK